MGARCSFDLCARLGTGLALLASVLLPGLGRTGEARSQSSPATPAVAAVVDPALERAGMLIGRALFLRGFFAGNELRYDASGRVEGEPKRVDWTLAGVNVERVSRPREGTGTGQIQLDGVRVAMRYNPDQHLFERHPQKDEKLRILLTVPGEPRGVERILAEVFAVGIDPALQRSTPPYWTHYFNPGLAWPADDLTGKTIIPITAKVAEGVELPVLQKKAEPDFSNEARKDRVTGTIQLRITVGLDGVPRRIAIRQPLGYGLDERAVESVERLRFRPGLQRGEPVAVDMILNQAFDVQTRPAP